MAATEESQMTKPLKLSLTMKKFACPGTSWSHIITVCVTLKELIFYCFPSFHFTFLQSFYPVCFYFRVSQLFISLVYRAKQTNR